MFFKFIVVVFILVNSLVADEYLNIDAKNFESNEKEGFMVFKGDVKMTKKDDILLCQNLFILTKKEGDMSKKQIPKSYEATGNVSFTIYTKDNMLKGKGDKMFYYPEEQQYIVIGNGYLEDTKEGKKLTAQTIYIDEKTGHTRIEGDEKKPVQFKLKLTSDKE
jgi:lipopolysaccharide transport protein LptA